MHPSHTLRRRLWINRTTNYSTIGLWHLWTDQLHPRLPHEEIQTPATRPITSDPRSYHQMRSRQHYSCPVPRPRTEHLTTTLNPFTKQIHDTRTSTQTRRQMFLHHYTPLWPSRTSRSSSTLRQSFLQQWHHQLTNTERHHRVTWHSQPLPTSPTSPSTTQHPTHHHLHRRILQRWRQTTTMPRSLETRGANHPLSIHD